MATTTHIQCPNCFNAKLDRVKEKDLKCPNCGTDFYEIGVNTVKYK